MQVSDMEKKPESARSATSARKSQRSGTASVKEVASAALQDQLEDRLAAHVGEHQGREPGERPVHGRPPAPSARVVADQEPAEDEPREDREHVLVREREGLPEELLREE